VARGIQQVQDGDLDLGILTLDAAVRRLEKDGSKSGDLSRAYLYLGIGYLGKNHETLARARFREALRYDRDLRLEPEAFPPRVLELFERAREEAPKKSGSKKTLAFVGIAGAAAGGVALAAGGGGGGSAGVGPQSSDGRRTETFTGVVSTTRGQHFHDVRVVLAAAGRVDATLTWTEPAAVISMHLYETSPAAPLASGNRVELQRVQFSMDAEAKPYTISVFQCIPDTPCRFGVTSTAQATFTLTVVHP
jgi:hypothetical protein